MKNSDNALIATDTYTTLLHIRCIVAFLQDYYCLSEIPGKRPPQQINEEVYTGLYFVMQAMNYALAYEMERIQAQQAKDAKK